MSSPRGASVLREALESVEGPSPDDASDYRIATAIGLAFLGRGRSGAPTLLVPLKLAPAGIGRRGGGFSLHPVSCVAFEHAGRRWEQPAAILECTESQLLDAFLVLVADVAQRLSDVPAEAGWPTLLKWVEEWQSLFARRALLSPEQVLGLWGELWLISDASNLDELVAAWRGPEREPTDLFVDGISVEVKAARQAHAHFMSQRQAERPVGVHQGYLLSMWVGIDPVRGVSLAELVDVVVSRVSDPPLFIKQVASLGYNPLDRDQYSTRFLILDTPRWFDLKDVPRVRSVDPGISHLRYLVNLDPDRAVEDDGALQLWRHFGRPAPPTATSEPR